MRKVKHVTSGDWRTLEWFFNATGTGFFQAPRGAQIKVRYGIGWLGKDSQKQTLDGNSLKRLIVGRGGSLTRARMQIKVQQTTDVAYLIFPGSIIDTEPPPFPDGSSGLG